MAFVTVKINNNSTRGKHLIALLSDMSRYGNDIQLEEMPYDETLMEYRETHLKQRFREEESDDLFNRLHA
ncbi:MAG TPA: hypothetical protein VGK10_15960 [Prolixibacteraceae bacterium]|jgi:hypothetical protein